MLAAPKKIQLAQMPTPFHPLDRLSDKLGGPRIWVKRDDLTHTAMSGNKLRKLEFVIAEAVSQGCQVLITCGGVQSNHCRATAIACAQLGLKSHLILRGDEPQLRDGNTLLADLAGANISYYKKSVYHNELPSLFEYWSDHYSKQGLKAWCVPTGASDEIGLWGYYVLAQELLADMNERQLKAHTICCATGSGGTHSGLALGLHHAKFNGVLRGYAVCDDKAYFIEKGRKDMSKWYQKYYSEQIPDVPELDVNDHYIGAGYGIAGEEIMDLIRMVARLEGVFLDPVYTAKAFFGMVEQIKSGEINQQGDAVFIHTGGIFGLYPYREQLCRETS